MSFAHHPFSSSSLQSVASRSSLHVFYLWLHALLFISSICGFTLFSSSLLSVASRSSLHLFYLWLHALLFISFICGFTPFSSLQSVASRSSLHLFYLWLHALLFISSICGFTLFSSSLLSVASRSFLHLFYLWLHALLFTSSICGFALFYSSSLLSLVTSLLVLSSGYQLQSAFLSHFPPFRRLNQTSSPVVTLVVLLNPLFIHVKRSIWRSLLNLHLKPKISVAAASFFFFNQELGCECSPICWLLKHSQRFHSALSKNYISIFSVPQNCWTKYKIVLQENSGIPDIWMWILSDLSD